jgi:hypothetical protein
MKRLILALLGALVATGAQAQQNTSPNYCNGAAIYDTAVVGSTKLVSAPTIGGIYVCGYAIGSVATSTISAKLTYSTPGVVTTNTTGFNPLITGALQVPISPGWTFISATGAQFLVDHPASYNGLFVPNGNQLNLTTSVNTGTIQAIVYYWTQNP